MNTLIETNRLILRELSKADFGDLCEMLQDEDVMKSWERTFTDSEVHEFIEQQLSRYKNDNVGIWAIIDKKTGAMVGYAGLLWGDISGERVLKLAYMLKKIYWHKGFAIHSATACVDYAFREMNIDKIFMLIRPENSPSIKVAEKLGAKVEGHFTINFYGKDMLHLIYVVENNDY